MQTNIDQKGLAPVFIIIGVVVIIAAAIYLTRDYFSDQATSSPSPSPSYQSLSEDPKYKEVKEKYNLSEEQLQILSTVDPNDND